MVITLIQRSMFSIREPGTRNGAFRVGKHYSRVDFRFLDVRGHELGGPTVWVSLLLTVKFQPPWSNKGGMGSMFAPSTRHLPQGSVTTKQPTLSGGGLIHRLVWQTHSSSGLRRVRFASRCIERAHESVQCREACPRSLKDPFCAGGRGRDPHTPHPSGHLDTEKLGPLSLRYLPSRATILYV